MKKSEALELMARRCRERNLALTTERTYCHWVSEFCRWKLLAIENLNGGVADFLSWLAGDRQVAVQTQKQALNALVFFYRHCLEKDVGKLNFQGARQYRRVPVWLSRSEADRLFSEIRGVVPQIQAQLLYGAGLRVTEMLTLRIKDLDFEAATITVRGGKGDKDRTVPMPQALKLCLRGQVDRSAELWKVDRAAGNPAPEIAASLARKLGRAQMESFGWFWLWPAAGLSRDPRSGIVRRHHLTDRGIGKAIKEAARRSGILKRVTPHVLRHSFATALLLAGWDIKSLSVLMGHQTTATTEIYLHCLPQLAGRVTSPLDMLPSNVIPMDSPAENPWPRSWQSAG